tara:strand:+ start:2141 stop:2488 length:348 start_codon:yes stop_codon:yes gene_type:complete
MENLILQYKLAKDIVKTTIHLKKGINQNQTESSLYSSFYNDGEHQLNAYTKTLVKYELRMKNLQKEMKYEIDCIISASIDIFKFTHYGVIIPSDVLNVIQNYIVCDSITGISTIY